MFLRFDVLFDIIYASLEIFIDLTIRSYGYLRKFHNLTFKSTHARKF